MAENDGTDAPASRDRDPTMERVGERVPHDASHTRTDTDPYAYPWLAAAALLLLSIGTVAYRFLEDWTWIDSFYFSSIAVTTVGFGDLVPSTDAAKLFTVAYVFSGVAIITSFLNVRLKRHARSIRESRDAWSAGSGAD